MQRSNSKEVLLELEPSEVGCICSKKYCCQGMKFATKEFMI